MTAVYVRLDPFGVHFTQSLVTLDSFVVLFLKGVNFSLAFQILKSALVFNTIKDIFGEPGNFLFKK